MHDIFFYRDKRGREPVAEFLKNLAKQKDKDNRIKLNKIRDYFEILRMFGTQAGEPFVKHIDGQIWELRPMKFRIFFVCWKDGSYILLHHFMKRTQKTPIREVAKAKANYADLVEREKR